ncbi:hypothetical protein FDC49_18030 [Clostridium sporogenes]|uniref:hypothetical protein n=1 Tax=Clostridium sporogenes TaxID=1509 RepID=UPI0013D51FB5|nr:MULTISPECIES: hypothetical protein [Clostridium]MBO0573428.1 hypothetical protein [Clostridium botulinum]NFH34357.1 hypothetical protein [Clostridium sporogenes]NFL21607.1 hypothetical protein [Clostridium sporogenes]NFN73465.1 hypothetical protein [Clostridium sporogenes]NFV23078.1 hypothetical protein [Clostridium sporogenes]
MEKIKCCNCSVDLREDMDIQFSNAIFELFCSKECAMEFYMKEMENNKVDVKNIRDYIKFAYIADGCLYHSDLDDDSCDECEDGVLNFYRFETIDGNRYEIYKCSKCVKKTKVRCK